MAIASGVRILRGPVYQLDAKPTVALTRKLNVSLWETCLRGVVKMTPARVGSAGRGAIGSEEKVYWVLLGC